MKLERILSLCYNSSVKSLEQLLLVKERVKRILPLLILALFLFAPLANAQAQVQSPALPNVKPINFPRPSSSPNLFGQSDYYTVNFRGNGEAVVIFKANLSNTGADPISTINLHYASNVDPKDIAVFQVLQEPQCIQYSPLPLQGVTPQESTPLGKPSNYPQACAQYQEPDYQNIYGNPQYLIVPFTMQNNAITLRLPSPIQQNKYGSYFIYYRSNGYAQKDLFGVYEYRFETLKIEDKIHNLQVGIITDSDFYLRGGTGEVTYSSLNIVKALSSVDAGSAIRNPQFNQFYNQIGYGTITKNASDLAPLESYKTEGIYANAKLKLYGKEITITVFTALLLLLLAVFITRIVLRKLSEKKTEKSEDQTAETTKTFLESAGISFLSVLLLFLYTLGAFALTQLVNTTMYYSYPYNNSIITLFILAVSFPVYLFFLFAPSVGIGLRKGWWWGLITFGATVVWTILFTFLLFALLFFLLPRGNVYIKPLPMMGIGASGKASIRAEKSTTSQ